MGISVENSYSQYQLMHTFLDNFQQGGKYSAQISSHQVELRREENLVDQKSLSIFALQIDYLNLENSVRNNEREYFHQSMCSHCGGSHPTAKLFNQ